MTNAVKVYTDKAIGLLDAAQKNADPEKHRQASLMALSYLRLAQLAEKSERTGIEERRGLKMEPRRQIIIGNNTSDGTLMPRGGHPVCWHFVPALDLFAVTPVRSTSTAAMNAAAAPATTSSRD